MAGGRIAASIHVAELIKSFGVFFVSKVLKTSATELATRFHEVQKELVNDQLVTSPPAMVEAPRYTSMSIASSTATT